MGSVLRPLIRVRPLKSQWRRLNSPPLGFPLRGQIQDEPLIRPLTCATNAEETASFDAFDESPVRPAENVATAPRQKAKPAFESQVLDYEEQDVHDTSAVDQFTINHSFDDLLAAQVDAPLHNTYSLDDFQLESGIEDIIQKAVEDKDGDVLLPALLDVSRTTQFLSGISTKLFAEYLDIIKDNVLVKKAKESFHMIHPWHYKDLPLGRRGIVEILDHHKHALMELFARWRQSGGDAEASHFRFLLRLAVEVEDVGLAKNAINALEDSGFRPTSGDLGNYLEALCFNGARDPSAVQLRRVSLFTRNIRILRTRQEYSQFVTHHMPAEGMELHDYLADEVNEVWLRAQRHDIKPTEKMMRMILIAQARQGNMDGVAETLLRYWGIDILGKTVPTTMHLAYARDNGYDLFSPSMGFCRDLAHVLGINGESPLSMSLLDQISQHHGLVLEEPVWFELLKYCHLQSTVRTTLQDKLSTQGKPINKLDFKSPLDLWRVMIAEPYNIKPNMKMLNILAITARRLRWENDRSIEAMYEGDKIQEELDARNVELHHQQSEKSETLSRSVHELVRTRRDAELNLIERFSGAIRLQRWFRLGLSSSRAKMDIEWRNRGVQDLILRFWRYRPTGIVGHGIGYETTGYHIFLHEGRAQEKVKMTPCDDGSAVTVQAREQYHGVSRLPHTRSMKLYWRWIRRMENRSNSRLGPLYQPQWFEAADVKDWNELAPQFLDVYNELKSSVRGQRRTYRPFDG